MDHYLVDYVRSGRAWLLVGSGPSTEMGYPSWRTLAEVAIGTVRRERGPRGLGDIEAALSRRDYPAVFKDAGRMLGAARLLQVLDETMKPTKATGDVYRLLARWPVPVYLTTNYDDEIAKHLASVGAAYLPYTNSEDHLAHLLPDLTGAIFKLHGDLRTSAGLVLTSEEYDHTLTSPAWEYWRTKLVSVFQMNRVIVVGHSLTDPNIRAVLEAAKKGSGVLQPVCWIAPDVSRDEAREYLEKYRIRVVAYDNRDGTHRNLTRIIENVSEFVPPRTSIRIQAQIAAISQSPLGSANAAAPGFFVFNRLSEVKDLDEKRVDVVLAALQSAVPSLASRPSFTLTEALELAGWPAGSPLGAEFQQRVIGRAESTGLLVKRGERFAVGAEADAQSREGRRRFEHQRELFRQSLALRLRGKYSSLSTADVERLCADIDASLTGYFREGGLSLVSTLFAARREGAVPASIIRFISEASAQYESALMRQAFCTVSVDVFASPQEADKQYLGRVSQGFVAFHFLGAFGEAALERVRHAKDSVWIVDSNVQILALALAGPSNVAFAGAITRLRDAGIRMFSTASLFDETWEHLRFAMRVVEESRGSATAIVAGASGQPPYRKANEFLAGFVRWRAAGNSGDWPAYLERAFGTRSPGEEDVREVLRRIGVETIELQGWPGFTSIDFAERQELINAIAREQIRYSARALDPDPLQNLPERKALPEAEAVLVVKYEREGRYHVLSAEPGRSPAWFVTHTGSLNTLLGEPSVTWQPEAFVRFAETISPPVDDGAADRAFETLLWGIARSGLVLIDSDQVSAAFGGVIDQTTLSMKEQREYYEQTLQKKYGLSLDEVLEAVPAADRQLATVQLANELLAAKEEARVRAAREAAEATRRAEEAEKALAEVAHYRKKLDQKKAKGQRKARKQEAKSKKKK